MPLSFRKHAKRPTTLFWPPPIRVLSSYHTPFAAPRTVSAKCMQPYHANDTTTPNPKQSTWPFFVVVLPLRVWRVFLGYELCFFQLFVCCIVHVWHRQIVFRTIVFGARSGNGNRIYFANNKRTLLAHARFVYCVFGAFLFWALLFDPFTENIVFWEYWHAIQNVFLLSFG